MSFSTTDVKFTYQWRIDNCVNIVCDNKRELESAKFTVPALANSAWYIKLFFLKNLFAGLWIDDSEATIYTNYSLSIGGIGWPKFLKFGYCRGYQAFGSILYSHFDATIDWEKYVENVKQGTIPDVLLIECCLWRSNNPQPLPQSPYTVSLLSRTLFPVENRSFFLPLKNYTNLPEKGLVGSMVVASGGESPLHFTCELHKDSRNDDRHEFCLTFKKNSQLAATFVVKTQVYLVDVHTKYIALHTPKIVYTKNSSIGGLSVFFDLLFSKKKDLYLRNGDLLLFLKFTICPEEPFNFVQSRLYDTSDLPTSTVQRKQEWYDYLDQKYKKHPFCFRLLAILIVILSILPHLFKDSIFGTYVL